MTEGTRSYLMGCHSFFFHPLFVLKAWLWVYGEWPRPWQIVCIFLHDIGICGRQYITGEKDGHWELGAYFAYRLFGWKGFFFCAGHTPESGCPQSTLWLADKASWLVAPSWWLWSNFYMEKFRVSHPHQWRITVAKAILNETHVSAHELYMSQFTEGIISHGQPH